MRITDWDDAYANRDHVPDADAIFARWPAEAQAFRDRLGADGRARLDLSYGPAPRNRYDLFLPEAAAEGLVVWVHGGYWRAFDKSLWSHFAEGIVAAGWAVAMPSYSLAPTAPIPVITREIAASIAAAAQEVPGPIRLTGHSAGGHLVSRVACTDTTLPEQVLARVAHILSVSGVHDLRPLLRLAMNADFKLDAATAHAESPALLTPRDGVRVTAWVGGDERPEFVRQTTLLANVWTGMGADMAQVITPLRHHFDVIDDFRDPRSALVQALLG
ncbi:alpha/beta hydrolase [Halovulum dunhuangense]|uniref:Alpha/beta hydrolase n=1 Tax=Halovulum dunhuangense TaxID=1505036 RepID=A0A849L0T3_9RHOB|nr:alpha/beta hydrolase [Halovulum dunhuangense]NNU79855.1 alpha/beta hydrolase [Halovulum dunhuangense]